MNENIIFTLKRKWQFVLWVGVVFWGVTTALLFQLFMSISHESYFYEGLVPSLIVYPITGVFFGLFVWKYRSKKVNKQ